MPFNSTPEPRTSPKECSALSSGRVGGAEVSVTSDHFEAVLDPGTSPSAGRRRSPLSRRVKWSIVAAFTAAHPALLVALRPIVGEASNSLLLAGPVVATLLLSLRIGVFFILINTVVCGF